MAQLSTKLPWDLANTRWASIINPILAIPFLDGNEVSASLKSGKVLVINHLLQRMQQGWFILDKDANAQVWRTAAFNDLTLSLEASADVNLSLWVF